MDYFTLNSLDKMLDTLYRFKKINDQLSQHKHLYEVTSLIVVIVCIKTWDQIAAVEIVIHLHNDDGVAASDTLNTALRYTIG